MPGLFAIPIPNFRMAWMCGHVACSWVSASLLVDMTWRNVPLEICIGCLVISVILDDQTYVSLADNACWFMSCPQASPNTLKSQLQSAASPQNLDMENHGSSGPMAHIVTLKMVLLNSSSLPVTKVQAPQITCSDTSGAASNKACTSVRCNSLGLTQESPESAGVGT